MKSFSFVQKQIPFVEFVILMAVMTSLIAFSIDAMLPALPVIGKDLGVGHVNDSQLIISSLFFGMAFGQMVYGPLSDSIGRKPAAYWGFAIVLGGSVICWMTQSFELMLFGRFLQGVGLAGPRVISIALIRDLYEGDAMARVTSFIMSIFILVPMVAPAIEQGILWVSDWRSIFAAILILSTLVLVWFAVRQNETLIPEKRLPFELNVMVNSVKEVCRNRIALGYTLTSGIAFSAFMGYLMSIQQVLQEQYALGNAFPLYFGILAFAVGGASFFNGKVVMRYGMKPLSLGAMIMITGCSLLFVGVASWYQGHPPLWGTMVYFLVILFCFGILIGNLNALAMEPLGHIAGVGSAFIGSVSTLISVPFGTLIGQAYNGTVFPVTWGFVICGLLSIVVMRWIHLKPDS